MQRGSDQYTKEGWTMLGPGGIVHAPRRLMGLPSLAMLLVLALLVSCGTPSGPNKGETGKTANVQQAAPQPGDVRVEDGVEYIYAKNRRFGYTPDEPEFVWVRKDEYSPGILESLAARISGSGDKKEREALEARIAKAEAELKGQNLSTGTAGLPPPVPVSPVLQAGTGSKLKRRVLVLAVKDEGRIGEGYLDDTVMSRIASVLEHSGSVICADRAALPLTGDPLTPQAMAALHLQGVQAIISPRLRAPSPRLLEVSVAIYDTEAARLLRQVSARAPRDAAGSEKDQAKAIDDAIVHIQDELLTTVRSLGWHARVASVDKGRTFLNAGGLTGLKEGDVLEVFGPGEQVIDNVTGLPIGRLKGTYKGEIVIFEVFGVDASSARVTKGGPFSPGDLVYLKK